MEVSLVLRSFPALHLREQEALKKPNDGIWSKPVCDEDLMKFETLGRCVLCY
jgi:hypothetical protein